MWRKLERLKRCQCVEISNLSNGSKDNAYTYLVYSWYILDCSILTQTVQSFSVVFSRASKSSVLFELQ